MRHFTLFSFHSLVAYLTTMRVSGIESPNRGAMTIRIISNPAGVPNRPTYVEPNLAYVNPNLSFPRSDRVRGTREHSTPPSSPFARSVHTTLAIAPRLVRE